MIKVEIENQNSILTFLNINFSPVCVELIVILGYNHYKSRKLNKLLSSSSRSSLSSSLSEERVLR